MKNCFEYSARLYGLDVDGAGACKPSALLNHLQQAATGAADEGGFGREVLLERYGAFWMLARSWFRLERPLGQGELTVRTWHRGGKGAVMYRDYDIFANGEAVGESVSAWVLADANTHKLLRLSDVDALNGAGGGPVCKEKTLSKLHLPRELRVAQRREMRYSDTDVNGHVNNTRYADFICDVLWPDGARAGQFVREMQLGYLAECRPGETLDLSVGEGEDGARYVRGVDETGNTRFESRVLFGKRLSEI